MAKENRKFTLPQCEYMKAHADEEFVLVAMPLSLVEDIDVVRDAIVTYMPGDSKDDIRELRKCMGWIENIEELQCIRDGK